jgi:VWFA-related protein
LVAVLVATAPFGPSRAAVERPSPPADMPVLAEATRVRLVLLPTTVTTRHGRPVHGLTADDFKLYEAGLLREIDLFATEESTPVSLAFLLDVSASMGLGKRFDLARQAVRSFAGRLDADDKAGLIRFADEKVDWVATFDTDRATLLQRLESLKPDGSTALYDALAASPSLVDTDIPGRKAILLITDGVDNASKLDELEATEVARRVAVPIYTLGLIPQREKLLTERARRALSALERVSTETGGALYLVHGPEDLDVAAAQLQAELSHQYVIGFYPQGIADGSFRPLRLTIERNGLFVRTRLGYYRTP